MNCCDDYGNCRQGRDCPIRVARVGRRMPKEPQTLRPVPKYPRGLHRFVLTVIGALYLTAVVCLALAAYA